MQTKVKTDSGRSTTKPTRTRTYTQPQTNRVANTVKRVGGAVGEAVMGAVTGGTSKRSLINEIAKTRTPKAQQSLTKTSTPIKPKAVTGSVPDSVNATRKKTTYSYRGK